MFLNLKEIIVYIAVKEMQSLHSTSNAAIAIAKHLSR